MAPNVPLPGNQASVGPQPRHFNIHAATELEGRAIALQASTTTPSTT